MKSSREKHCFAYRVLVQKISAAVFAIIILYFAVKGDQPKELAKEVMTVGFVQEASSISVQTEELSSENAFTESVDHGGDYVEETSSDTTKAIASSKTVPEPQSESELSLEQSKGNTSSSDSSVWEKDIITPAVKKIMKVPYISQEGTIPTGCESVSAVMLLKYYQYNIKVDQFVSKYLDHGDLYWEDGVLYGPHPNEAFIGDPYSSNGYGCYAPVIKKAFDKILDAGQYAKVSTTESLDQLVETYVKNDIPVLVWATMNMKEVTNGTVWTVPSTGKKFQWKKGEHCLVLVGYDEENYYFNDPFQSNGTIAFSKSLSQRQFAALGSQSIVILEQ